MKKIITIILTLILLFGFSLYSIATSMNDLKNQQYDKKLQIEQAERELDETYVNISETQREIAKLSSEIYIYEQEIETLDGQIVTLQKSIEENEDRLEISAANFERQEKQYIDTLVAQYKAGDTTYLDILLSSGSIIDFISNYHLVNRMAEYNVEILEKIQKEKLNIEAAKLKLENQKIELEAIKTNKQNTADALANSRYVKDQYLGQLTEQERNLQASIEQYEREQNDIEARIRALSSSTGSYTGGQLGWPVPYTNNITAYFEDEEYYYELGMIHRGIDIAAAGITNQEAVAAADGVVIVSEGVIYSDGSYGSYGNYVIIDHGGGMATLYAHGNQRLVSVGDVVRRGDPVLLIGSTGWSTGPHLHFEVRLNGIKVDPLPYLY